MQRAPVWTVAVGLGCGLLAGIILGNGATHAPQALAAPEESARLDTLASDVAILKDKAVDQAHVMADVGYHFSRLWFAGKAGNWPLAQFYCDETRSYLRWAVRVIPIRKDSRGQEVNLPNILEAFENTPLKQLQEAIAARDPEKFEASPVPGAGR